MTARTVLRWAILHRTGAANIDGAREWLEGHPRTGTLLFGTREEARRSVRSRFGYLAQRQDLALPPHGWLPCVVMRVRVTVECAE